MATATITFDLTDFDDRMEHERAIKSSDMAMFIWELVHNSKKGLESKIERAIDKEPEFSPYDSLDLIYEHISDLLDENGIVIDRLVI